MNDTNIDRICKNCKWRKPFPGPRSEAGVHVCRNEKLADDRGQLPEFRKDALLYQFSESGEFIVGEDFGCVHFEEKAT